MPYSMAASGNAKAHEDTSARAFARWLTAFNDPDLAKYAAFVRESVPDVLPYVDEDLAVREGSGGFNLVRLDRTTDGVSALVHDRDWNRRSRVLLTLKGDAITDVSFRQAPDLPPPAPLLDEGAAMRAVGARLATEADAGRFSGAVLISRGDRVLMRAAYGSRTAGAGTPLRPDTRFCIASVGKLLLAVGVLRLVQAGRLGLDETIGEVLPAYPGSALARTARVRHLLAHSGGTGDFMGPEYEKNASELKAPSDFIVRFGNREATAPPGTIWAYSNFGYIVLGAMIEQRTGSRWDAYLDNQVLRPAGMAHTSRLAIADGTAVPLSGAMATGLKPLPFYVGLPPGGGYSTIDDLHRLALALEGGVLLDRVHLELLRTPVAGLSNASWGLGARITRRDDATCYGHRGAAPGCNADFTINPATVHVVAVLSNRGFPHAQNVATYAANLLPRPEARA